MYHVVNSFVETQHTSKTLTLSLESKMSNTILNLQDAYFPANTFPRIGLRRAQSHLFIFWMLLWVSSHSYSIYICHSRSFSMWNHMHMHGLIFLGTMPAGMVLNKLGYSHFFISHCMVDLSWNYVCWYSAKQTRLF